MVPHSYYIHVVLFSIEIVLLQSNDDMDLWNHDQVEENGGLQREHDGEPIGVVVAAGDELTNFWIHSQTQHHEIDLQTLHVTRQSHT